MATVNFILSSLAVLTSLACTVLLLREKRDTLDAEVVLHIATLEKVYRERPVTLFRVIYGLRDAKIRSFAEAFNLRKK